MLGFYLGAVVTQTVVRMHVAPYVTSSTAAAIIPIQESITPKTTSVYFVGDIMLARNIKNSVHKNFGGDYNRLFENIGELKNADILFTNLEGDVSDKGANVGSIWSFRMDPIVLPALKNFGFDVVSFANNHVGDWGMLAFKDTLHRLRDIDISAVGAGMNKSEAVTPTIIEKNGTKFGFIGFTDVGPNWLPAGQNTPGILLASDPDFANIIQNAKAKCDVLIVSFHWGVEYKKIHNKRQETLAHNAIDNGADMVIGHHPHVIQDTQVYKDKPIVYSLGNFIFDQYFSADTMQGMVFQTTFLGSKLQSTKKQYIYLNKYFQPSGVYDKPDVNPCPKPQKSYIDQTYLNIGQSVPLPDKSYVPRDLGPIESTYSASGSIVCMDKDARTQFMNMIKDASKERLDIQISTAFRSYDFQNTLYKQNLVKAKSTTSDAVAKPGYSEHQLGVAMDLTSASIKYAHTSKTFRETPEYTWMKDNAYKYGFIESYPEGKEKITGYIYEPWHYRYVGIEKAKAITESGLTINQFFNK
jgi:poly-gamma-glutamate capsule biosynthesis protein CapA/YwtB (metallophosphatase superfamily)/LAS superfamily LD-carboxypeptidase LdcB